MSNELYEIQKWQSDHPNATDKEFDTMLTERGYSEPMTVVEFIEKSKTNGNGSVNTPAQSG